MKLIDADAKITALLFDEEHEETKRVEMSIADFLDYGTEEGCPDAIMAFEEALELPKEQETILLRDGHHVRCMQCGEYWCDSDREGNPFPMNFCPVCGKAVKLGGS